jgi:hypothetical protein
MRWSIAPIDEIAGVWIPLECRHCLSPRAHRHAHQSSASAIYNDHLTKTAECADNAAIKRDVYETPDWVISQLSRVAIHQAESQITDVPGDHDHGLASVEHWWRPSPRGCGCFVGTTVGFSPRFPLATALRSKFRAAKRRADHHLEVGTRSDYAAAIQGQEPRNKVAEPNGISDCADRTTDML